ncbi:hypothetical protein ABIF64_000827 [Bradyrhizobium japonicum]|nr:hypothetical protein [Bradyrhizobium japonicum]MCP1793435.1 hypothetical protein [Bradyrhizobium japonicum]MCP1805868.1 hypothetical protein [Bradyrhizobium japonicum]MCP1814885.1 hypothetical protein [Bradyrhizobium japonicum]MCP1873686.1 hypothetical protein [Bradyrhizobium japonicum]
MQVVTASVPSLTVSSPPSAHLRTGAGTHNHWERFGDGWQLLARTKPLPVVMGPGLALRVPRDDSRCLARRIPY